MKRIAVLIVSVVMTQHVLLGDAVARSARCVVVGAGSPSYQGKCHFSADEGGSFSIAPVGTAAFGGATLITVAIVSPGVAEVRGLTRDGINSRWGEAKRDKTDPACWMGDDFKICVY